MRIGPLELWDEEALQTKVPGSPHPCKTFSISANLQIYQAKWHLVVINVSLIVSKAEHFFLLFFIG